MSDALFALLLLATRVLSILLTIFLTLVLVGATLIVLGYGALFHWLGG